MQGFSPQDKGGNSEVSEAKGVLPHLESSKFLVAGAGLRLWVNKTREDIFMLFSFPGGFREHGEVQTMESRAATPPSAPVPTSTAEESSTRPPPETNTSSDTGSKSATCSRSSHGNEQIPVLQLPVGTTCAACGARSPAQQQGIRAQPFGRAMTHFGQTRHSRRAGTGHSGVLKHASSFVNSGHEIHTVRYIIIKMQSKKS